MNKRRIYIKIFLCLLPFVFFISNCGVPNYFYLGSSYIRSEIRSGDVSNQVAYCNVRLQATDMDQLNKCRECPSIFLFYFIGNDSYYSSSGGSSELISRFSNEYKSLTRKGAIINVNPGVQHSLIERFTPTGHADLKVSLYAFTFGSGKSVERPKYHIPIKCGADLKPLIEANGEIDFRLEFDKVSKELRLLTNYDVDTQAYLNDDILLRADRKPFSEISASLDNFATYKQNNLDCQGIGDGDLADIKLYILMAMCASNGSFDNIYWSRLYDVCSFNITGGT